MSRKRAICAVALLTWPLQPAIVLWVVPELSDSLYQGRTRWTPLIRGMVTVLLALVRRYPLRHCHKRIARQMVVLACISICSASASASATSTCGLPAMVSPLQAHGNGDGVSLKWSSQKEAGRFRVWAQWRVPEGEVLRTHEVVVDTSETHLPPSPARWRPLKLSIEIQSICEGGAVSTIAQLRQLQFDAQAEAACPPVDGVRFDRKRHGLFWTGETHDSFLLSFHRVEDGQVQARQEVVGTSAEWPAQVRRPAVIRAVRACGEAQKSRATFLLVR